MKVARVPVILVSILTLLSPPHRCQSDMGELDLFEKSVTAQAVVETLYKTLNEVHNFTIKNSVEYYVKFMVPEIVIKRLEKEKDKHIFQVRRAGLRGLQVLRSTVRFHLIIIEDKASWYCV